MKITFWVIVFIPFFTFSEPNLLQSQTHKYGKVIDSLILAYNNQDITAFVEHYNDDVEFYMYPQRLMFKGKEKLIERYGLMFEKLKCVKSISIKRIIHKNIVIDHESSEICLTNPDKVDKYSEFVTSYQIENGKISKVVFFK